VLNIAGSWERPGDDDIKRHVGPGLLRSDTPMLDRRAYINFLTEDEVQDPHRGRVRPIQPGQARSGQAQVRPRKPLPPHEECLRLIRPACASFLCAVRGTRQRCRVLTVTRPDREVRLRTDETKEPCIQPRAKCRQPEPSATCLAMAASPRRKSTCEVSPEGRVKRHPELTPGGIRQGAAGYDICFIHAEATTRSRSAARAC